MAGMQTSVDSKRPGSSAISKKLLKLAIAGGLVFWAITIVISFLPIASAYRGASASSFSHSDVLIGALPGGLVIGFCISYALIRLYDKIPTQTPVPKSVILSIIALVIGSAISFVTSDSLHYFLVGVVLDVPRFLLLGIVVGYLYNRLDRPTA